MKSPIGIFDSGVGGLSIALGIRKELPSENLLYVADHGFSPYGTRSKKEIEERAVGIVEFLLEHRCKAIVVACNTATVSSINRLRQKFRIPIVGVEPGIKPAAQQSVTGVVGILATENTLSSDSFQYLSEVFSEQAIIETQACPRFVELVEEANLNSEETNKTIEEYVLPLISKGADQIVLGCTHFSFLSPAIQRIIQGKAIIVDTAVPVTLELKRRLANAGLLHPPGKQGCVEFWSSNASREVSERISLLWGDQVEVSKIESYFS